MDAVVAPTAGDLCGKCVMISKNVRFVKGDHMPRGFTVGREVQWAYTSHGKLLIRRGIIIVAVPTQVNPLVRALNELEPLTLAGQEHLARERAVGWPDAAAAVKCIERHFSVDASGLLTTSMRRERSYLVLALPAVIPAHPKLYWPKTANLKIVSRPSINQAALKFSAGMQWGFQICKGIST